MVDEDECWMEEGPCIGTLERIAKADPLTERAVK